MCRSQQLSEVTEESERSEEERELIRENFGSCSRVKWGKDKRSKIDLLRDPTSNGVKSLKAMVRIDNQIIQLTVDTGSPVSFLNWAMTKDIIDKSNNARFIPSDELNLANQFVDYNN